MLRNKFTLAMLALSSIAIAQEAPLNLLNKTQDMGKQINSGQFKGDFVVLAQHLNESELKDFPNFVSTQKVGRARQLPRASSLQNIDSLELEVSVNKDAAGKTTESRNIKKIILDAEHTFLSYHPGDLEAKFTASPGLQDTGFYSHSMGIPFSGQAQPEEIVNPSADLRAACTSCPPGTRIYKFDTAPSKPMSFKDDAASNGPSIAVDEKGYAYLDKDSGQLLKVVADGYNYPAGSKTQFIHQEVEYGQTKIGDKTYWLPKSSVVAIGPSVSDYQINRTEYTGYREFSATMEIEQ